MTGAGLAAPAPRHAPSYLAALREGFRRGNQPAASDAEIAAIEADFPGHLARITAQGGTIRLPSGERVARVPFSLLWLAAGDDFIGEVSIRHELNDWLRREGGHIGYGIRPSLRRKGFGVEILRQTLICAKRRGIARVLLTCAKENAASARAILANGGVLDSEAYYPPRNEVLQRFWIDLGATAT